jgi:hypothetical protein
VRGPRIVITSILPVNYDQFLVVRPHECFGGPKHLIGVTDAGDARTESLEMFLSVQRVIALASKAHLTKRWQDGKRQDPDTS